MTSAIYAVLFSKYDLRDDDNDPQYLNEQAIPRKIFFTKNITI